MADLTTLDPTLPPDTEVVSNGASRIRDTRAAVLGSFGPPSDNGSGGTQAEHHLNGPHRFPNGDATFPGTPNLPAAGNLARIFIDTVNGRMLYDTGAVWNILSAISKYINYNSLSVSLSAAPSTVCTFNVNSPPNSWFIAFATMLLTVGSPGQQVNISVLFDGGQLQGAVEYIPNASLLTPITFFSSNGVTSSGPHTVSLIGTSNGFATISNALLLGVVL